MRLTIWPLGFKISGIRDLPLQQENLLSFRSLNLSLPLRSIWSKHKTFGLEVVQPVFVINGDRLNLGAPPKSMGVSWPFSHIDVSDGELIYRSRNLDIHIDKFDLRTYAQAGGPAYQLVSPNVRLAVRIEKEKVNLEGALEGEARDAGKYLKINRCTWQTRDLWIDLNGKIFKDGAFVLNSMARGSPENVLRPLLGNLTIKGLIYAHATIAQNHRSRLKISGSFNAPSFDSLDGTHNNLRGDARWDSQDGTLQLTSAFTSGSLSSRLAIRARGGEVRLNLQDALAATLTRILAIETEAPLQGRVSHGEITITKKDISGQIDLENGDETHPADSPFKVSGRLFFRKNKEGREIAFNAQNVWSNVGRITLSGQGNTLEKRLDVQINANLYHLENAHPLCAHYLDLDLKPWRLEGGQGVFQLTIRHRGNSKQIRSQFKIEHFLSRQQALRALTGDVSSDTRQTRGRFMLESGDLSAQGDLQLQPGSGSQILFNNVHGESRKIVRLLGLDMDLRGTIDGHFSYRKTSASHSEQVDGEIQSRQLFYLGNELNDVHSTLHSQLNDIHLPDLSFQYKNGIGQAAVDIDYGAQNYRLQGAITAIELNRMRPTLQGRADLHIKGEGRFFQDPISLELRIANLAYYPDRPLAVQASAEILTDFSDFSLKGSGLASTPGSASPIALAIRRKRSQISGSFNVELKDLNLLIPWKNNSGQMSLQGQLASGSDGRLSIQGIANFSGTALVIPNFSHALNNFQARVTFKDGQFLLSSMSGEMGGGQVQGNGTVSLNRTRLKDLSLHLVGKEMLLYPMDRLHCKLNADLTLSYSEPQLLLQGNLNFLSATWEREIDEGISFYTHSELSAAESKILSLLQFDLKLSGDENIWMSNSLGRISGGFTLRLSGSNDYPILSGVIEGKRGELYFADRHFNMLKAKLIFSNRFFIDPQVQMESETFIQNYRIRFDIRGTASHPKPEFVSAPPLPTQDILALISLGEVFKRTGSTEVSSQQGSTAMITTKLTNRANKLLGLDLLRIDPLLTGQSSFSTSRLTVGKSISKDLIVVYSTNLSTYKQEILYFQYQLSPSLSVIGMKNEEGKYSLDIRFRQRR